MASITKRREHYPSVLDMIPWNNPPIRWKDGWNVYRGPKIGSIALDDNVVAHSNQPQTTLYELMEKTFAQPDKKFFVILFGWSECDDVCPNMKVVADELEENYPMVNAFAITPYYDDNVYDTVNNVLGDPNLSAEKKYGATGTAVYVFDTDKRIVWKSSGLLEHKLHLYLKSQESSLSS